MKFNIFYYFAQTMSKKMLKFVKLNQETPKKREVRKN